MRVTQHQPPSPTPAPAPSPFAAVVLGGRDSATVRVRGEIDAATAGQLEVALRDAADEGRSVRIDLDETTFIDSAGIRVLARSMGDLRARGSRLSLVAASPNAENILRITGILDVLKDPAP